MRRPGIERLAFGRQPDFGRGTRLEIGAGRWTQFGSRREVHFYPDGADGRSRRVLDGPYKGICIAIKRQDQPRASPDYVPRLVRADIRTRFFALGIVPHTAVLAFTFTMLAMLAAVFTKGLTCFTVFCLAF